MSSGGELSKDFKRLVSYIANRFRKMEININLKTIDSCIYYNDIYFLFLGTLYSLINSEQEVKMMFYKLFAK